MKGRGGGASLRSINRLYLFGVAHALHVGGGDAGAREDLSWVLPVAAQHLSLQVGAQRLNVVAPDAQQTHGTNVKQMFWQLKRQSNWPSRFMFVQTVC